MFLEWNQLTLNRWCVTITMIHSVRKLCGSGIVREPYWQLCIIYVRVPLRSHYKHHKNPAHKRPQYPSWQHGESPRVRNIASWDVQAAIHHEWTYGLLRTKIWKMVMSVQIVCDNGVNNDTHMQSQCIHFVVTKSLFYLQQVPSGNRQQSDLMNRSWNGDVKLGPKNIWGWSLMHHKKRWECKKA